MTRISDITAQRLWDEVDFTATHTFGTPWLALTVKEQEFVTALLYKAMQFAERLHGIPNKPGSVITDTTVDILGREIVIPVLQRDEHGRWYGVDEEGVFRGFITEDEILNWQHGTVTATA